MPASPIIWVIHPNLPRPPYKQADTYGKDKVLLADDLGLDPETATEADILDALERCLGGSWPAHAGPGSVYFYEGAFTSWVVEESFRSYLAQPDRRELIARNWDVSLATAEAYLPAGMVS